MSRDTGAYCSHYAFLRFGLGESHEDALWMAAFAERDGIAVPTAEEQAFIREHWDGL